MLKKLLRRNLWSQNVAAVQLLGLCPLLAVSNSVANASGLAIASAFVLIGSATLVSLMRRFIPDVVRLPMFVLVIATFTTIAVLIMEAFAFTLYMQIALFMQIIVTNCMILGRITQVASQEKFTIAILDAVTTSIGFAIVLVGFGAIRELTSQVVPLALDPTGAFLIFGLLLAAYQLVDRHVEGVAQSDSPSQAEAR